MLYLCVCVRERERESNRAAGGPTEHQHAPATVLRS